MTYEDLKRIFSTLNTWKRSGERAPHKPLLLLYVLAGIQRDASRLYSYTEIKEKLQPLLIEFGPHRKLYRTNYPFIRLYNDGIWELKGNENLDTKHDWGDRELIENLTYGGFTEEIFNLLKNNKSLVGDLAKILLAQNFPETIHEDILSAIGLDIELSGKVTRDPTFRGRVLRAYEYSCAVCGFNVRLGNVLVAVEAAHIKWHQAGGPDTEQNGIALCTMHHKLFDRGVFTLTNSMRLQVAENAHGTKGFEEWVMKYHGKEIRSPHSPLYRPKENYVNWHIKEVFHGPARYVYNY